MGIDEKAKDLFPQGEAGLTGRRWSDLARLATRSVAERLGRRLPGIDLLVHGTVPREPGCAASTALALAYLRALYELTETHRSPRQLAGEVAQVERAAIARAGTPAGDPALDAWVLIQGEVGHVTHVAAPELQATTYAIPEGAALHEALAQGTPPPPRPTTPSRLAHVLRALDQQDAEGFDRLL